MLKKEYRILECFAKKPWQGFTFREIKLLANNSSEGYVHGALKRFVKNDILLEEKVGNNIRYFLNLKSPKARCYAGFVSECIAWNKKKIPHTNIEKISLKVPSPYYTLLITGSFALQKQTKNSDLDVVILCDDSVDPKKINSELAYFCEMSVPEIHLHIFRKSEFLTMIIARSPNFGWEVLKNCLVLYGGSNYFQIIHEAVENGFNGKNLY